MTCHDLPDLPHPFADVLRTDDLGDQTYGFRAPGQHFTQVMAFDAAWAGEWVQVKKILIDMPGCQGLLFQINKADWF